MEEEIEIDNIFDKKPKKIKSGKKGKRVELEIVKSLNDRFSEMLNKNPQFGKFSRTVGSGNRWGQNVYLSQSAINNFSGDIVCPDNFRFVLESKGGYNDIDLCSAFDNGQAEIDSFIKQVVDDSERSGRKPLLFWKKDRKPRLAFIRSCDIPKKKYENIFYFMKYREWVVLNYNDLIKLEDNFFFK
jgi:hypothetical protein